MNIFISIPIFIYSFLPSVAFALEHCPRSMVFVPRGFYMAGEIDTLRKNHTDSFCIDRTEVTQAEYKITMGENPSFFDGENNPVETVSLFQTENF